MRVTVLGGGIAGSAAALLLRRSGHDVTILDRDAGPPGDVLDAFADWERPGVGHFRQPHNFLGRARRLLEDQLPDLYARLLAAGATELDQRQFLGDAPPAEGDDLLRVLLCRRPLFDAVLQQAVAETGVVMRTGTATGLDLDEGRLVGVRVDDGTQVPTDLLVDASGRTTGVSRWLAALGLPPAAEESDDCGLLYYSRHFALRDGVPAPKPVSVLAGPRGDIGFFSYVTFVGDNRTMCATLLPAAADKAFRDLRDDDAHRRVLELMPACGDFLHPDAVEPISRVLPMGAIRNTFRQLPAETMRVGVVAVGDALVHTNPTLAWGASQAMEHAVALADVVADDEDPTRVGARFQDRVSPIARIRYEAVVAEDRDRLRMYAGERIDPRDPSSSLALFLRLGLPRVATRDPALLRALLRRVNALDPPDALARDAELLARGAELARDLEPAAVPSREDVLAALAG